MLATRSTAPVTYIPPPEIPWQAPIIAAPSKESAVLGKRGRRDWNAGRIFLPPKAAEEYELPDRGGCQSIVALNNGANATQRLLVLMENGREGEAYYAMPIDIPNGANDAKERVALTGIGQIRDAVSLRANEIIALGARSGTVTLKRWIAGKPAEGVEPVVVFSGATGLTRLGANGVLVHGHQDATPRIDEYDARLTQRRSVKFERFPKARVFQLAWLRGEYVASLIQGTDASEHRSVLVRLSADLRVLGEQVVAPSIARFAVNESSGTIAVTYYQTQSNGAFAAEVTLFDSGLRPLKTLSTIENPAMGVVAPDVALGERTLWFIGSKQLKPIFQVFDLNSYAPQSPALKTGNRIAPSEYQYLAAFGAHAIALAENRRLVGGEIAIISECNGIWVQRWVR